MIRSGCLVPREDLSADQLTAVERSIDDHLVIRGAPGSGKTQVLAHRARHLIDEFECDEDSILILVFTKVLRSYIRSWIQELELPEDMVLTFDQWCKATYEENIGKAPWDKEARMPNFEAIRSELAELAADGDWPGDSYDAILVDEGQDLDPEAYDLLSQITEHLTVCVDHKQQLYDRGSSVKAILQRLSLPRENQPLLHAFRCSPKIVTLASAFIVEEAERQQFQNQCMSFSGALQTPLLYMAPDFESEMQRLAEVIRNEVAAGRRTAVILPQRRQVFGFQQGLMERGIVTEVQGKDEDIDFQSDTPKVLSYHGAKGLTFDSVCLPRLVSSSFSRRTHESVFRHLFVGITRATEWVYMSTRQDSPLPALNHLNKLRFSGGVEVQEGPVGKPAPASRSSNSKPVTNDLDFL
jgi:superfamily I DNA/RNA helicase